MISQFSKLIIQDFCIEKLQKWNYQFDSRVYRVKKRDRRRDKLADRAGGCTGNTAQDFIGG